LIAPGITAVFVQNQSARLEIEINDEDAAIGHVLAGIQHNPCTGGVSGNPVGLLVWQYEATHLMRPLGLRDIEHGEAMRLRDGLQPPVPQPQRHAAAPSRAIVRKECIRGLKHLGSGAWAAVAGDGRLTRIGRGYLSAVRQELGIFVGE
jgi:hypothetical protein